MYWLLLGNLQVCTIHAIVLLCVCVYLSHVHLDVFEQILNNIFMACIISL